MIASKDFRTYILRPTLLRLGLYSEAAENLLIGTAATESRLGTYLVQRGGGPALGIYQIEPKTHRSIWDDYLAYHPVLADKVKGFASHASLKALRIPDAELISNLDYATAIARVIYYRRPEPLPEAHDIYGLALYYKQHFNTPKGKATTQDFLRQYQACGCAS